MIMLAVLMADIATNVQAFAGRAVLAVIAVTTLIVAVKVAQHAWKAGLVVGVVGSLVIGAVILFIAKNIDTTSNKAGEEVVCPVSGIGCAP